jgi:hypothetical protein
VDLTMAFRPHDAGEAPLPGSHEEPAPVLQWVGLMLPPAVFFAHLQLGYVLVPWACTTGQTLWVHFTGIVSIALSVIGTSAAWRTWMRAGREVPGEDAGSLPRTRLLGAVGTGTGAIFTLILFAQWIAGYFIRACQ